ncbi:MAG TPA: DNA gyrase inhibitor YacG [Pirellulales bacterium]
MALTRCPTCRRQFDSEQSPAMPFCSERCRRVDLGRWLNEDYGLPFEPSEKDTPDDDSSND